MSSNISEEFNAAVPHLEAADIDGEGYISPDLFEKPNVKFVIIFAYMKSCIHCINAKPDYTKVAEKTNAKDSRVFMCALEMDTDDKRIKEGLEKIKPRMRKDGILLNAAPKYIVYDHVNRRYVEFTVGRTETELAGLVHTLMGYEV